MPNYLFHIWKDGRAPEVFDAELKGHDEARIQAARLLGEELKDHPRELWGDRRWHIDVADECGVALFSVSSSTSEELTGGVRR